MGTSAKAIATYADIEALPENMVGEIINGVLHAQARPTRGTASPATRSAMS